MTDKELNKTFLNTLKAPYYDRMVGNSNTNFSDVVSVREMIENGIKLGKIESVEAKKPTPKRKREKHMRSSTKKKHTTLLTHDNQIRVISHTTNTPREIHKGTTNPTLGQWLVSLLCPHQYK